MAQLLFQSDPDDPITNTLLNDAVEPLARALEAMREAGELTDDADPPLLARTVVGADWSTILLWVKGLFSLDELRDEYVRHRFYVLYPFATARLKRKLDADFGLRLSTPAARNRSSPRASPPPA